MNISKNNYRLSSNLFASDSITYLVAPAAHVNAGDLGCQSGDGVRRFWFPTVHTTHVRQLAHERLHAAITHTCCEIDFFHVEDF